MTPRPTCNQCTDTGCQCPAKVAKSKPISGGNVWYSAPEPTSFDRIYYWACRLAVAAVCLILFGITVGYFYIQFRNVIEPAFWAWAALNF